MIGASGLPALSSATNDSPNEVTEISETFSPVISPAFAAAHATASIAEDRSTPASTDGAPAGIGYSLLTEQTGLLYDGSGYADGMTIEIYAGWLCQRGIRSVERYVYSVRGMIDLRIDGENALAREYTVRVTRLTGRGGDRVDTVMDETGILFRQQIYVAKNAGA